jgi:hypothetical protein
MKKGATKGVKKGYCDAELHTLAIANDFISGSIPVCCK